MKELLGVAVGGGLGAVARWALCDWTRRWWVHHVPLGTLAVNVIGGLLIGLIAAGALFPTHRHPVWTTTLIVGCLGGFTTFSAFSLETMQLATSGRAGHALLNIGANVGLALLFTAAGLALGRALHLGGAA
jgi:fluoride exporter